MLAEQLQLSLVARKLWERYGTPEKQANALRLEDLRKRGVEEVDAYPWRVIFEPVSVCNLRCPGCPAHQGAMTRGMLKLQDVQRYLGDLWPYLVQVNLFNWGEPFLNKQIDGIVSAIHDHGVGTQVHSNMNYLPEGLAERVITSGLDFLIVSIDGVTQPVYEAYRKNGRVDVAFENLERFLWIRKDLGSQTPRVVWRYLCFPHNLHEIGEARELAKRIGVDDFALGEGNMAGQIWTEFGPKAEPEPTGTEAAVEVPHCNDLWDFPAIHFDGSLMPCCYAAGPEFFWGKLGEQRFLEAYNTEGFRAGRRLAAGDYEAQSICRKCGKIPQAKLTVQQQPALSR